MTAQLSSWLAGIRQHAADELRPLVPAIDRERHYPEAYLRGLGERGGFAALGRREEGGLGHGLAAQMAVLRAVGQECGATAFSAWCQSACAWYLHQSRRSAVRARYLTAVLSGRQLAGTGMSNTVKHLAGLEKHLLRARPADGGYVINGALPWVSNLGPTHVFAATAQTDTGYVMFMLRGDAPGLSLKACPEFCALEGTRTFTVVCREVAVSADDVLATPAEFADLIGRIKPGFVLLQVGMAAGIIDGCLDIMVQSNRSHAAINRHLSEGEAVLRPRLAALWRRAESLAQAADEGGADLLPVLQLRAEASELALAAAQAAALHAGAKGYLLHHPAQRRSREAMFVAIVTPALKHLRYEIERLRAEAAAAA